MEMGFSMIKARISDASDGSERRRADRHDVELDAKLRELGSEGVEARVVNLSATGFMAEAEGVFEVGSRVWLIIPGRERANAVVKWVAAGKLGAEFAEPVSVGALR